MGWIDFAPVLYGLASAACWGAGDFSGGLATKRAGVYAVVLVSQCFGALMLVGLAVAFGERLQADHLLWGGLAGMGGGVGLVLLYRALATGQMGVAAPVSAVISAAIPALVGAAMEGQPGMFRQIGFGLALAGVWLVSRTDDAAIRVARLGLPFLAGLGFGLFLVFIGRVSGAAVFWPLVAARASSMGTLLAVAALTRQPRWPPRPRLPLIALAGVLDVGGNAFYALAAQAGRLDVAAVLASLYPATTVMLAWLILKERFTRLQSIGMVAALAAIVLIAV